MSISPQQAFDAVHLLDSRWVAIERRGPGLMVAMKESKLGVCLITVPDLVWPEGVTSWPPPEPKWVIPTDEDARQRPSCRVRDSETEDWFVVATGLALVAVSEGPYKFLVMRVGNSAITRWSFCEIKAKVES